MKQLELEALTRLGQTEGNLQYALTNLLKATYTLAVSAQGLHWNVKGLHFVGPLHSLFGEIYEDLFETSDEIAERAFALHLRSTVPINVVDLTNDHYLANRGTYAQMIEWLSSALLELAKEFTKVYAILQKSVNDQGYAWKLCSQLA